MQLAPCKPIRKTFWDVYFLFFLLEIFVAGCRSLPNGKKNKNSRHKEKRNTNIILPHDRSTAHAAHATSRPDTLGARFFTFAFRFLFYFFVSLLFGDRCSSFIHFVYVRKYGCEGRVNDWHETIIFYRRRNKPKKGKNRGSGFVKLAKRD